LIASFNRRAVVALLGASALAMPALGEPAALHGTADGYFAKLSARWLDGFLRTQPVTATQLGDHRFDHLIDDMGNDGRGRRLKLWRDLLAELGALDHSRLSKDNQVDAAILANQLRYETIFQSWAWDPQSYSALAGNALYALMAREFAPLADRMRSATARMTKLPALFAQMRENLILSRVPAIHAETVSKQHKGVVGLVDSMIAPHADVLSGPDRKEFDTAVAVLRKTCGDHQAWLDKTLVPGAKGDFRIGQKAFDEKLAFTLNSPLSRKEINHRAETAMIETRARMYTIAREVLANRKGAPHAPDKPSGLEQQAVIEAALAIAYADKPARDQVVATAEKALADATAFVRQHDLITLPDSPVQVVLMPEFNRGVAVAYCDSPGPLERRLKTFFDVSPIPDDWSNAQTDSFLREYNRRGIADITVHEAMPGHYVQLWHANSNPSVLRAVLASGSFVEGWAVYAENLMAESGFLNRDPLYRLVQLKILARTIVNAILDQAIHVDGMSREDAMKLMRVNAFQQESEAAGKWTRASLTSTQLSTYFVGREEHNGMRAEAERKAGKGFNLKSYHDKVLSYGSAPARYVRALMFDEAVR